MKLRGILLGASAVLILPAAVRCQEYLPPPSAAQAAPAPRFADIATLAAQYKPDMAPGSAAEPSCPAPEPECHGGAWPEVWGLTGIRADPLGVREAPNGIPYDPLGTLDLDLNIGLLPNKQLYLYSESRFWAQKPNSQVTNSAQGNFDFSKREFDMDVGAAWNYWGAFELRGFAYSDSNLNRGDSEIQPDGYNDGVGLENRYYFGTADKYDVAKLNFVSFGYYPSKNLIGLDGNTFKPGFFARAYLTYDLNFMRSYLYADTQYVAENGFTAKLLDVDAGLAARPFERLQHLELQLGTENVVDVQVRRAYSILYTGVRVVF